MIFTEKKITITNNQCKIDSPVVLYRGDYNVEVRFTIVSSPYKYSNKQETNVIESTEASYGQLVIQTPGDKGPIFSEITATKSGAITFTITAEMIDEITEVGNYTFQIRLLDENKESRATIPEVVNGIEIREPIATEDISNTNEVGVATVGYAITTAATPEDAFDSQGNYNKTTWVAGDRITAPKLNKMEAAIDGVNKKVASAGTSGGSNINDTTASATTTYSSNKIETIKKDIDSQIEYITNKTEMLPIKNTHYIMRDCVPVSQQNININDMEAEGYIFNDEQITTPDDLVLGNFKDKFSAISFHSTGLLNAVISYNDGTNDITKEIELTISDYAPGFFYTEYHESDEFVIAFGFDYSINKFGTFVYYWTENMEVPAFYEIKNVTISYNYYTNLIHDKCIADINYSKINNIPYQLNYLVDGKTKTLFTKEYVKLFDNLFIWDANKINDRLDSTSGVKQNVYRANKIQIKQKDGEGIGFGQYIPASTMDEYKLFVSAGKDVIIKVYNRKQKTLKSEISDFNGEEYKEIAISDSYPDTDGIFIAFTVKDSTKNFYGNTYVSDLILCKSDTFLTKQEVNEKVDKSQLSFNSNGELVVTIDGISKIFVPKTE